MAVCKASRCKKRELCMKYSSNYFKYNHTHEWEQLIDWSQYGSGGFGQDAAGNNYVSQTCNCGDDSITYPMFEPIELENKEEMMKSLRYIDAQLSDGYIDLGLHDEKELEIVKKATDEYKANHGLNV